MNKKAEQFIQYIQTTKNTDVFSIKEVSDKLHTTLFYSNIQTSKGDLIRCMILINDSQDILIRVNLKNDLENEVDVSKLYLVLNELNCQYPLFKFFYDEQITTIILEVTHFAHEDFFSPAILYSYLIWVADFMDNINEKLNFIKQ